MAKADAMTTSELAEFRGIIKKNLETAGIDSGVFAVIGATDKCGSQTENGRHYQWGDAIVENDKHCDIHQLREYMEEKYESFLKESENRVLEYRRRPVLLVLRNRVKKFLKTHQYAIAFLILAIVIGGLLYSSASITETRLTQKYEEEVGKIRQKANDEILNDIKSQERNLEEKRLQLEYVENALRKKAQEIEINEGKLALKIQQTQSSFSWAAKVPAIIFGAVSIFTAGTQDRRKFGPNAFPLGVFVSVTTFIIMILY